jgi:hypothetical protein
MHEIESSIDIEAPPTAVWRVFTDFASYPDWNPFVRSLEGELQVGQRLRVRLQPPGRRAITMRPTVHAYRAEHELRWVGHLGLPRLFDGEHRFTIEPLDGGHRTRFVQSERFRGVLVPLLASLLRTTETAFESMNEALRDRAEASVRGDG